MYKQVNLTSAANTRIFFSFKFKGNYAGTDGLPTVMIMPGTTTAPVSDGSPTNSASFITVSPATPNSPVADYTAGTQTYVLSPSLAGTSFKIGFWVQVQSTTNLANMTPSVAID